MITGSLGIAWAKVILECLCQNGVQHVCVAPGSRSTCLVLAAEEDTRLHIHTHFDERSLAFFALGLSKVRRESVALITTSGSAVANVLPALVEARVMQLPLICLTADRPPELHNCGANQTLEQEPLLASAVRYQVSAPVPNEDKHSVNILYKEVAAACDASNKGPVHINVPFREPFLSDKMVSLEWPDHQRFAASKKQEQPIVKQECVLDINNKRVLCIVANTVHEVDEVMIREWSQKHRVPVLAECSSSLSYSNDFGRCIDDVLAWIERKQMWPDQVVCIGAKWISKAVQKCIGCTKEGVLIHDFDEPQNWLRAPVMEQKLASMTFLEKALPAGKAARSYYDEMILAMSHIRQEMPNSEVPSWSAENAICKLSRVLQSFSYLFVGNSLAVRHINNCLKASSPKLKTMTQRGLSGIDGLIATSAGIAESCGKPVASLLGDISFFYDVNALAQVARLTTPLVIFVLNNNGGKIFESLPIANNPNIESLFVMPQNINIKSLVQAYGIQYQALESMDALNDFCVSFRIPRSAVIVELKGV